MAKLSVDVFVITVTKEASVIGALVANVGFSVTSFVSVTGLSDVISVVEEAAVVMVVGVVVLYEVETSVGKSEVDIRFVEIFETDEKNAVGSVVTMVSSCKVEKISAETAEVLSGVVKISIFVVLVVTPSVSTFISRVVLINFVAKMSVCIVAVGVELSVTLRIPSNLVGLEAESVSLRINPVKLVPFEIVIVSVLF